MTSLLIQPPFADPTQPYLGLPTLKGHLRRRGLDARVIDLNLEAAHWLLGRDHVKRLLARLYVRQRELERARQIDQDEFRILATLRHLRPRVEALAEAEHMPLAVFRDPDLFYSAAVYGAARRQVTDVFEVLSALHAPYRFDFNTAANGDRPWSLDAIEGYIDDEASPLDSFYRATFDGFDDIDVPRLSLADVDFVGISVVFPSQIPEAFYLCRAIRERAPHAFLALGGPCLHQAAIHMDPEVRLRLLDHVDGIGLYEGEETVAELLTRLAGWKAATTSVDRAAVVAGVPNLLHRGADGDARIGPPHAMSLGDAEPPDYSDLDLDRYLAPSRILLYAPTRGCYWDKCSFCYYGLSDVATAKYREVPPERAAAQLKALARRFGVKNFYISCDVLSPAYAVRLAQAILDAKLRIRWSSDLKIERYFTRERADLLYQSGLRSAAFGIESGSDRILALMRKGTDRATMTEVNRAFHDAGVATEWMTFTDHPGESVGEALDTVRWIGDEADSIDLFIVGTFGLQPGSDIAQRPSHYGVGAMSFDPDDDFHLYARWEPKGRARNAEEQRSIDRAIDEAAKPYGLSRYPWAGANSTHHSFLHFIRYGQNAFKTHLVRHHGQSAANDRLTAISQKTEKRRPTSQTAGGETPPLRRRSRGDD